LIILNHMVQYVPLDRRVQTAAPTDWFAGALGRRWTGGLPL